MDGLELGANDLNLQEIEALLADEGQSETPPCFSAGSWSDLRVYARGRSVLI